MVTGEGHLVILSPFPHCDHKLIAGLVVWMNIHKFAVWPLEGLKEYEVGVADMYIQEIYIYMYI